MKRTIEYNVKDKRVVREINYIPMRYIIAVLISVFEILAILSIVIVLFYYQRWFALLCGITHFACVLKIISSDDNPDYKVPWLLFVLGLPVIGFMLYFLFYSRKLDKKFIKRIEEVEKCRYEKNDSETLERIKGYDLRAGAQAKMLTDIARTHVFENTKTTYFRIGEDMHESMLRDLSTAEKFIYLEYFIIEEGTFWNSILDILKQKAKSGVDIKVIYDDIGCMSTLPGNYYKILRKSGIDAVPFSILKGQANNEFNNRSHRKIMVIDGKVGYTGGVNIADEYINEVERFGHWKDTGIRLEGEAVWELTRLFLSHYGINSKKPITLAEGTYPEFENSNFNGYVVPFGDGPHPIYKRNVGKIVIQNMLDSAVDYVYMTTPYLIIDNDMCASIENAAMRGVDVRIIVPHIPDKKLVFGVTKSFYHRLMDAGVRIYEYKPGFIHAKNYISDDKYAMVGTINLDYRSLVHHFENGVWMCNCDCIKDIKQDVNETLDKSVEITRDMLKTGIFRRFIRSIVRVFAPLL